MRILLISLGCDKNLVDSEFMLGKILDREYELTDNEEEADAIIVNTCCFIHDAKEESIETILEMAQYKKTGSCKALIVCGCLAQRYSKEIEEEIPEVDAVIGTTAYEDIAEAVENVINKIDDNKLTMDLKDINYLLSQRSKRVFSTGTEYSYLKIAEGCDKHCTYCVIPSLRGSYRSVPKEELIEQAEYLAECGVKELIIVAQETTLYGTDIYGYNALPELLHELCSIDGIRWLRILYAYPEDITEQLAHTMADEPKICNYIDMPIQHASDRILKRMGRRTSNSELKEKVAMLRKIVPDIALRTTLITGFPGETRQDHQELLDFVKAMRFDRLGVFKYSAEENTPAAEFDDQIDDKTMQCRYDELMKLQQTIAFEKAELKVGTVAQVIIEGELPDESVYIARTRMDAPGIDGCVFLPLTGDYVSGDIVNAEINDAVGYDLLAVPVME